LKKGKKGSNTPLTASIKEASKPLGSPKQWYDVTIGMMQDVISTSFMKRENEGCMKDCETHSRIIGSLIPREDPSTTDLGVFCGYG
jgi:hypothetical protein